jgi:asparagine synthase (glutamine-hydrolysing)
MCGIAGIYQWDGGTPEREVIQRMTARLAHRGPDGEGIHLEQGVALGHRRLSIIDLSERAAQPMSNARGDVWLTFNGEIYNYQELRRQLEHEGARFRTDSDSETILHLYEAYGDDLRGFLNELRGMFAFAIWDSSRQRLVVARDRLGIKPLVFYAGPNFVAFASEIDALTEHPDVPRKLDWTSLYDYLTLLTAPAPHTIFQDVEHLKPGALFVAERGKLRAFSYWRLEDNMTPEIKDAQAADEELEATLSEAARLHLVADVEVGAFLSGGVDSGLVTALATEQGAAGLQIFSATFPDEEVDEGPWAKEAARRLGTTHTEFAAVEGFLDGIENIARYFDQPMAITSAVSLYHLSKMARERVKVVLTGDGGDELFGGYERHRAYPAPARAASWMPEGMRPVVGRVGVSVLPAWARRRFETVKKAHGLAAQLARDETSLYVPRLYYWKPEEALNLLPPEFRREVDTERYRQRVRRLFSRCPSRDRVTRMLFVDLHTTLVDEMLAKVDRMTMAHGLEARVPLLDHKVVELAMRIAGPLKRQGGVGKLPLRRLVAPRLGQATAQRGKYGFNSPLEDWLRDDGPTRAKFNQLWPQTIDSGAFDRKTLARARENFYREGSVSAMNLFTLLVYGLWASPRQVKIEPE